MQSFPSWISTTEFLHNYDDIFFLIILLEQSIQKVITFQIFYFIEMTETFDREKIVDCMFDPITSSILAELEDGEKECSFLAQQSSVSESEVLDRLSYLIEHEFISKNSEHDKCVLSANSDKLASVIENSDNFDATISGLEKMDSYLN
jgi:plasmid replication initiation protein